MPQGGGEDRIQKKSVYKRSTQEMKSLWIHLSHHLFATASRIALAELPANGIGNITGSRGEGTPTVVREACGRVNAF